MAHIRVYAVIAVIRQNIRFENLVFKSLTKQRKQFETTQSQSIAKAMPNQCLSKANPRQTCICALIVWLFRSISFEARNTIELRDRIQCMTSAEP